MFGKVGRERAKEKKAEEEMEGGRVSERERGEGKLRSRKRIDVGQEVD